MADHNIIVDQVIEGVEGINSGRETNESVWVRTVIAVDFAALYAVVEDDFPR